jgi:hypothetical protein
VVGGRCRARGQSGGVTAATARGTSLEALNGRADALYVINDALVVTNLPRPQEEGKGPICSFQALIVPARRSAFVKSNSRPPGNRMNER